MRYPPLLFCFTQAQSSRRQSPGWRYGRAQECCRCSLELRRSSASHFDSSLLHNAAPTRNHNSTSIRMTPLSSLLGFFDGNHHDNRLIRSANIGGSYNGHLSFAQTEWGQNADVSVLRVI